MNQLQFFKLLNPKFVILLFCIIYGSSSCEIENNTSTTSDAVLVWQGEYSQHGCGFILLIDNIEYKPRNEEYIDTRFKRSGQINVTVEYILLNEIIQYQCGAGSQVEQRESIDVLSIREK